MSSWPRRAAISGEEGVTAVAEHAEVIDVVGADADRMHARAQQDATWVCGAGGGGFGLNVSNTFCQLAAPLVVRYSLNCVRWKNVRPVGSALALGVASAVRKYDSCGLLNSGMPIQPTSHLFCVFAGLRRLRMMNE